jgi:hypothetical protein
VPCELVGQMVSTRLYPTRVKVVAGDLIVADHERLTDKGKTRYDWRHYIPLVQRKPGALRNGAPFADLPETLQRLRRALLREPGGDRLMAKVLALEPDWMLCWSRSISRWRQRRLQDASASST